MTDESTLLSDQVFQLNTILWALEELPEELEQGIVDRTLKSLDVLRQLPADSREVAARPDDQFHRVVDPIQEHSAVAGRELEKFCGG